VPVDKATTRIRLMACHTGMSETFLRLMRDMFGGEARVTAPNHFHTIAYSSKVRGFLEYLTASFDAYSLDKEGWSRDRLISEYKGLSQQYRAPTATDVPY